MKTIYWTSLCAASLLAAAAAARADEFSIKLKPGPGAEVAQAQCSACHSLDYILTNSPFPKRTVWDAEVNKMIKVFGATIEPNEAKTIIDYLAKEYGS
ncbi:MAG: cytochrome c [Reyranella sp.]|nr:cytochrome c [Reyranella sp.]